MVESRKQGSLSPWWRGALYYFFFVGVTGMYRPFLSVYFERQGLSGTQIGFLWALLPLMAIVGAPLLAFVADKHAKRRHFLAVSLVILVPLLFSFTLPHSFLSLLVLMLFLSFFREPADSVGDALVVSMASEHRLNYGHMRVWGSLGFALASLFLGVVWQRTGFNVMFILSALMILPIIVMVFTLEENAPNAAHPKLSLKDVWREPVFLTLALSTFFFSATYSVETAFASIYMESLGGTETLIGILFGLAALGEIPGLFFAERIMRRLGGAGTLMLAYALYSGAHLAYVFIDAPWLLLLFSLPRGVAYGLFFVGTVRLIDARAPRAWSATMQGIIMGAVSGGVARLLATALGGVMYDVNPRLLFLISAVFAGAAFLVLLFGGRYLKEKPAQD